VEGSDSQTIGPEPRPHYLVAGAQFFSGWLHERQTGWSGGQLDVVARPPAPAAPPLQVAPAATVADAAVAVPDAPVVTERAKAKTGKKKKSLRPVLQPILRAGMWIVIGTAGVAGVALVVWMAQSYWRQLPASQPPPPPPKTAIVRLESAQPGSTVSIDGVDAGPAPVTKELAPGKHVVEFHRRKQTRSVTIDVTAGQPLVQRFDWNAKANVSARPSIDAHGDQAAETNASISAGWLHVSAPFELQISEGGRTIVLDDHYQALLPVGSHQIHVVNRDLAYQDTIRVDVKSGKVASIDVVPRPSTLSVTANAAAEVLVDGERVGATPLTNYPVNLGARDIVVRSSTGVVKRFPMTVTTAPVRLDVDFSK
jgi:hypothetical protein